MQRYAPLAGVYVSLKKSQEIIWPSYPEMCEKQLKYVVFKYNSVFSLTLLVLPIICSIEKNVHKMLHECVN